jgi:long-chain acyl-CoA synthetase
MMQVGAISVPIYPTISEVNINSFSMMPGLSWLLCLTRIISEAAKYQKGCSLIAEIYTFDDVKGVRNWKDVCSEAKNDDNSEVEKLKADIKENDLVTII